MWGFVSKIETRIIFINQNQNQNKLGYSSIFPNQIGMFQSGKDFSLEQINCCLLAPENIYPEMCPISCDCDRTEIVEANLNLKEKYIYIYIYVTCHL